MVEKNPWYTRVEGPFPERYGCVGVKPDGGGSMRGRGLVGPMKLHHAVMNRDMLLLPIIFMHYSKNSYKTEEKILKNL